MIDTTPALPSDVYRAIIREYGNRALDVSWRQVAVDTGWRDPVWRVACRRPYKALAVVQQDDLTEPDFHIATIRREDRERPFVGVCPECNIGYWGASQQYDTEEGK